MRFPGERLHLELWLIAVLACGGEPPAESELPITEAPGASDSPAAERPFASVATLAGDARVRHIESGSWERLRLGDSLAPGDTIQTMDDAEVTIRMHGTDTTTPSARARRSGCRLRANAPPGSRTSAGDSASTSSAEGRSAPSRSHSRPAPSCSAATTRRSRPTSR